MKKTYYFVPYGWGHQHGSIILEKKMTPEEFEKAKLDPNRDGAYFEEYISAHYYTLD